MKFKKVAIASALVLAVPLIVSALNLSMASAAAISGPATCQQVELVAHRGMVGSTLRHGPDEDSSRSMVAALLRNADTAETDWRLNRARVPFEMHDASVRRMTRATGLIQNKTTTQMQHIRLLDGQHIRRFAYHVRLFMTYDNGFFPKHHKMLENELKPNQLTSRDARHMLMVLNRYGATPYAHWSSFSLAQLATMHAVAPDMEYQLLAPRGRQILLRNVPSWVDKIGVTSAPAVAAYYSYPSFIAAAHAHGFKVNAWDADSPTSWTALVRRQVDAISTDRLTAYHTWCSGS